MFTSRRPDVLGVVHHEECDSCAFTSHRPDALGFVHHEECGSCVFTSHRPDVSGVAHHADCDSCVFTGQGLHEPYKSGVAEWCPSIFPQKRNLLRKT